MRTCFESCKNKSLFVLSCFRALRGWSLRPYNRRVPNFTLAQIASLLGCPAPSHPNRTISGMANLLEATESDLSFLGSDAYLKEFEKTKAAAVVVKKSVHLLPTENRDKPALLIVDNADLAQAKVLELLAPPVPRPKIGIDSTARIAPSAVLSEDVSIAANVVIGERTTIGRGTILHPGVVVGDDVIIGDRCEFFPNVVIRERISIGHRVTIHAGSVLGTDGFGYRWDGQQHVKIPQIGTVIVEDDVEIGSCVCIDRAKFSSTKIGRGTKIDNLVQIAHNCQIGPHCIIVGQAGLAGSGTMGTGVIMGGQTAVRDHITIGD